MDNGTTWWSPDLFDNLDHTGPVPLYFQVTQRLEEGIRSGTIPAGARLENEITIAQQLNVSRPTIRRAMQELVDKGLLVRRRGIGTQVVRGKITRQVELTSLYEDLRDQRRSPGSTVLIHEMINIDDDGASTMGIEPGTEVLHIRRLRTTDGIPVAILDNLLPPAISDITQEELATRGLYEILRRRGITIRVAHQRIGARSATTDEGQLLQLDSGAPVLTMDRVAHDDSGSVFEYGRHCYRPDLYSFETTLVAK